MKISIITPSWNSEKYIENNLRSVHLEQKGDFSIEHIIVDGNSTDKTIEIVQKFKEEHNANIKLIQGKDKSMYDAINKGIKAMDGEIWACLNTDDLYYPEILEIVSKEFSENKELDVVYGYPDMIDEHGKFSYTLYLPDFDLDFLILKGYCLTILQPAAFFNKRVIEKVGYFDINYKYASDYDYCIRIGSKCKMKLIKKSFTQYRIHPDSITWGDEKRRSVQSEETATISRKYIKQFGIKERSLFFDNLNIYARQIKLNNFRYILKRLNEISISKSWGKFLKERII